MQTPDSELGVMATLASVGVVAAIGQMLLSRDKLTWRVVMGRAIVQGLLGVAAGAILLWIPNVPFVALVGLSAGLSSIGLDGLTKLAKKYFSK